MLAGLAPVLIPSPASAHEFQLVVVRSDQPGSRDTQRGFRLAVDQSPDVSHPEGENAGDHLGGVDVTVVEIESGAAASRDVDEAIRRGAAVVVLLVDDAEVAADISAVAREREVVLVMPHGAASPSAAGAVVFRPRAAAERDIAAYEAFANRYADSMGTPPTTDAVSGYDAGRLIDELVLRLGGHLQPGPELARHAEDVAARLIGSEVFVPATGTAAEVSARASSREGPDLPIRPLVAVALVALGSAAVRRSSRRRRLRASGR